MVTDTRPSHSAAPSLQGYLYQCRYALLEAVRRLPSENRISISIETLDDVVFYQEGEPIELLQTKHHVRPGVNLSDSSPDLWKTLRVWIDRLCETSVPPDSQFFFITTALCEDGTAAAYLRPSGRDPATALRRLTAAATTSQNRENHSSYCTFKSLPDSLRERLVSGITILDGSPTIDKLGDRLKEALFYNVDRRYLDSYLGSLEGWWYRRVLAHLRDDSATPIPGEELESECSRIREQFRQDNLVIDDDIIAKVVDPNEYEDMKFVKQLSLIDVGAARVLHAIKNYYRASEHRSKWVREELLHVGDLERYEDRLFEEWETRFHQMKDQLREGACDLKKLCAGQGLYSWAETGTHRPLRTAVTEPFVARGTYHRLAEILRVGWHPEYRALMGDATSDGGTSQ